MCVCAHSILQMNLMINEHQKREISLKTHLNLHWNLFLKITNKRIIMFTWRVMSKVSSLYGNQNWHVPQIITKLATGFKERLNHSPSSWVAISHWSIAKSLFFWSFLPFFLFSWAIISFIVGHADACLIVLFHFKKHKYNAASDVACFLYFV